MRRYVLRITLALTCCMAELPFAASRPEIDAVLLLDTSASMLTSDPFNQRKDAIRGFMALMGDQDRLAVMTFGDEVRRVSDFVNMGAEARRRLEALVLAQLTPDAAYTNLLGAVDRGLEQLQGRRAEAQAMVVLFTDGRMDMGDARLNERLTQELKQHVLPRYRGNGARIYALAFTDGSDLGLLDAIARDTGGFARIARQPEDVWRVFGELFEIIKKPDRLPVSNGRFVVDANVREFKVFSGALRAAPVSLRSPSGRKEMSVPVDNGNPVVKIRNPEVGEWTINNASGNDTVVAESTLTLRTDLPDYATASRQPIAFKAWIEHENAGAGEASRPSRISLTVSGSREIATPLAVPLPLQDSEGRGEFTGRLPVLANGSYTLELDAVGRGFRRSKHLTLTVVAEATGVATEAPKPQAPVAAPKARPSPPPVDGLIRMDGQTTWKMLQILLWANLMACVLVGVGFLWHRKRRRGK